MNLVERVEEIWTISTDRWISVTMDNPLSRKPFSPSIILCHGLTGDKIGPQKLLSQLSWNLANFHNVQVVRFDFTGSGLSSGEFQDTSLESMVSDALHVASKIDRPILWMGISTGALIALMACKHRNKNEKAILISNGLVENPIFDNLEEDPVPLREGQLFLNKSYFKTRENLSPQSKYLDQPDHVTIILGSKDTKHFMEAQNLRNLGVKVETIPNADHLFTDPFHRNELNLFIRNLFNEK